uniref:Uncharacterized protein n=1 Tax=Panagrolaimus sp. JU765 TaxID=591449 RepID=A0AC34RRP2_9BILA
MALITARKLPNPNVDQVVAKEIFSLIVYKTGCTNLECFEDFRQSFTGQISSFVANKTGCTDHYCLQLFAQKLIGESSLLVAHEIGCTNKSCLDQINIELSKAVVNLMSNKYNSEDYDDYHEKKFGWFTILRIVIPAVVDHVVSELANN